MREGEGLVRLRTFLRNYETERRKAIRFLRKTFPEYGYLPDTELFMRTDLTPLHRRKKIPTAQFIRYQRIKKDIVEQARHEFVTNTPELAEVVDFLKSLSPCLENSSFYYIWRSYQLDRILPYATKHEKGLAMLLNYEAEKLVRSEPSADPNEYDLLPTELKAGMLEDTVLSKEEMRDISAAIKSIPRDPDQSFQSHCCTLEIDESKRLEKVGIGRIESSMSAMKKLFVPTRGMSAKVSDFFGVDAKHYAFDQLNHLTMAVRVQTEIIDCFRHMPKADRVIMGRAFGINAQKITHKAIGEELGITESRISQIVKATCGLVRNWLSSVALEYLSQNYRLITTWSTLSQLSPLFTSRKLFFKFLGTICDHEDAENTQTAPISRTAFFDAMANWGVTLPYDEIERYLLDHFGFGLEGLYDRFLTTDAIDDPNWVITPEYLTVQSLPHKYLVAAIATTYPDGIDSATLLDKILNSPRYDNPHSTIITEVFRKSSYLITIDKAFYRHVRYYDPTEPVVQLIIENMVKVISNPRPDHIKNVYELHSEVPGANVISPYYFSYIFQNACEAVDFAIHPSYFDFLRKSSDEGEDDISDEEIYGYIKNKLRAVDRTALAEYFVLDIRYMTMRLSQMIRQKKIIRTSRETYDTASRAFRRLDNVEVKTFIVKFVSESKKIVDFSYLATVINNEFGLKYKTEFYQSLFIHYFDYFERRNLHLRRYLVSNRPIDYPSLRGLINAIFDPEKTDLECLELACSMVLIDQSMYDTILKVWLHDCRVRSDRLRRLKAS